MDLETVNEEHYFQRKKRNNKCFFILGTGFVGGLRAASHSVTLFTSHLFSLFSLL